MSKCRFEIRPGFPDSARADVARLFWAAFSAKLIKVMGPDAKALAVLTPGLDPAYCLTAQDPQGRVLGAAGFKTADGAFVGGTMADYRRVYGLFGGVWRAVLLSTLEREVAKGSLLMDGIFVAPEARGKGIGTALLQAIKAEARARGQRSVRLDVIDSNKRARALYLGQGFEPGGRVTTGPLRHIFGFQAAQTMIWTPPPQRVRDAASQRIDIDR